MWESYRSTGQSRSVTVSIFHSSVPGPPTLFLDRGFPSLPSWTNSGNSRRYSGYVSLLRTWSCVLVWRQPSEHKGPQKHPAAQAHGPLQTPHTLFWPHPGIERRPFHHSIQVGTYQGRVLAAGSQDFWGPCQGILSGSPFLNKSPLGAGAARVGSLRWLGGSQTQSPWSAEQSVPRDRRRSPSGGPTLSSLLGPGEMSQPQRDLGPCPRDGQTLSRGPFVQRKCRLIQGRTVSELGSLVWAFGWPMSSSLHLFGWH